MAGFTRSCALTGGSLAALALALSAPACAAAQSTSDPQQSGASSATDATPSTPLEAPAAAPQDPATAQATGDVVVTGSRLRAGFDAPTPVSIVSAAEIQRAAPPTISDFVNQLPALSGSTSPRTNKAGIGNNIAGANLLNLRNLGVSRTFVLLNGKRVTPTTLTSAVDINTIPTALVKRVDVVTGGASAAYGSDAVAGVVNFVLDTEFEGVKGSAQGGVSQLGDASNIAVDLSYGTSFADSRGHFVLSGAYTRNGGAIYGDRDWYKGYKIVPNPNAAQAGQTAFLVAPYAAQYATLYGLVIGGPLTGYYFGQDGGLAGTNFPTAGRTGAFYYGDESVYNRLGDQSPFTPATIPVDQQSVYGRASFDLTEGLKVYAEGSFGRSHANTQSVFFSRTANTAINVQRDNFYLPVAVRNAMIQNNVTSIPVALFDPKLDRMRVFTLRKSYRGQGGLQGSFANDWKWDVSYQYGRVTTNIDVINSARPANYALAVDAVANPANPSQPVCRSTITAPTNGCVPFNIFGAQPVSDAVLAFVRGTGSQDLRYTQTVTSANLSGDLFSLPAGAVSIAVGGEYRTERAVAVADPISQASQFFAGNFKNFFGKYNVKEAYGEIGIPVFKDSALGRSLDLNAAGRYTDYSTSGSVETWKAGARYEPVQGIELRVTRSRDIRAPNLQELFQPGLVTNQAVNDPANGNALVRFTQTVGGNLNLRPEKANTLTAGLILQPAFLPGFRASIDYYDIKIGAAINTYSGQFVINQCSGGNTSFCQFITRDSANALVSISLAPFNAQQEQARGVDVELSYVKPIGDGTLDARVLANYVDKLNIVTPVTTITRAGEVSNNTGAAEGVPHWRGLASLTYDTPGYTAQLKGRFVGAAKFDDAYGPTTINLNHAPAIVYLDTYLSVKIGSDTSKSEFFFAVDNVLDTDPPIVIQQDNAITSSPGTNPFLYDTVGRTFRAGFRFKM